MTTGPTSRTCSMGTAPTAATRGHEDRPTTHRLAAMLFRHAKQAKRNPHCRTSGCASGHRFSSYFGPMPQVATLAVGSLYIRPIQECEEGWKPRTSNAPTDRFVSMQGHNGRFYRVSTTWSGGLHGVSSPPRCGAHTSQPRDRAAPPTPVVRHSASPAHRPSVREQSGTTWPTVQAAHSTSNATGKMPGNAAHRRCVTLGDPKPRPWGAVPASVVVVL